MAYDTIVRGNIVLASGTYEDGTLAIEDGKIAAIHLAGDQVRADQIIDATGCWIFPGAIDAHVHAGSSRAAFEGFARLTRGAAVGGVTTVIDMPYDDSAPATTPERIRAKMALIAENAVVDVALFGTLSKFGGARQVVPLARSGVAALKLSTYETDPDRFPAIPDSELVKIFVELAKTDLLVAFHAENGDIIDPLIAELRPGGISDPRLHCASRPPSAETTAVLKLLELARNFPVKLHIVHLTVPFGFELVAWFRERGVDVTAETCIQYLVLDESYLGSLRGLAKCNPPLRSAAIQEQLWRALLQGHIDFVTSDHAPWLLEMKTHENIFDDKSGLPGVETLVPLLFSHGVHRRGMSPQQFARFVATAPAKRYGLYPRKGALIVGADADLTIIDPAGRTVVRGAASQSVATWSPYDGMELQGRIARTMVRGVTVYDGESLTASPGHGRFIPPVSG